MNVFTRTYMPHRRAYTPRLWPSMIVTTVMVVVLVSLKHAGPVLSAFFGVALGWTYSSVRWRLWRKRHPIISAREYLDDIRESARWN